MSAQHVTAPQKIGGWELYRDVMKSPKHIVAPMVDQSELAWRILSRRYGGELVYTPMINAGQFAAGQKKSYRSSAFNIEEGEEGGLLDRPLIVQFAANDPTSLLKSAKIVEPFCDAVDINFGCPQDIARKGRYGAFLCEDWDLIHKLINVLHNNLSIPVTAKFRIFAEVERTIKYAQMMEKAGAQILTCHGRTRDQRGHKSGLADWTQIQAVKKAVSVPVFANGNVLYPEDVEKCLEYTGADAYMSAEPQLHNPAIFVRPLALHSSSSPDSPDGNTTSPSHTPTPYPFHTSLALEYLEIVTSLKTRTTPSAVKAHLFKLMAPALTRETDLRDRLGRASLANGVGDYIEICKEMQSRMERDAADAGWDPTSPAVYNFPTNPETGLKTIPHWLAQPRVRPPPPPPGQPTQSAKVKAHTEVGNGPVGGDGANPRAAAANVASTSAVVRLTSVKGVTEIIPVAVDDDPALERVALQGAVVAGEKRPLGVATIGEDSEGREGELSKKARAE